MDSVKAAPKLNRSTTLLTGSAAYSLQDTLHQLILTAATTDEVGFSDRSR